MREQFDDYPSLAQIAGHALNSIFLDSMEVDLERLQRINRTLSEIAAQIAFLLSDDAATITGSVLLSDGGYTL